MNTLNQAFIKAYQRHGVVPPPHASFREAVQAAPVRRLEAFAWPEVCESLLAAAGTRLAALASELVSFNSLGPQTLLVTGCRRCEGRTTLLLALARHWSGRRRNVLLVDADCRRPGLAERLGVTVAAGCEDFILGRAALAEALVRVTDGVTLLPLRGPVADEPMERAGDPLAPRREVFSWRFDCICFDAGPLATPGCPVTTGLLGVGAAVDTAVVVHDARHRPSFECGSVARRFTQAGVGRWHLVENFT